MFRLLTDFNDTRRGAYGLLRSVTGSVDGRETIRVGDPVVLHDQEEEVKGTVTEITETVVVVKDIDWETWGPLGHYQDAGERGWVRYVDFEVERSNDYAIPPVRAAGYILAMA